MIQPAFQLTRLTLLAISLLVLTACERESYTTWSCHSVTEVKATMILRKAVMEFQDLKLDYCGSLGNQSYFDVRCPGVIQESKTTFTPASGTLVNQGQQYQCTAL
jgi:hypothetical protein